MWPYSRKKVLTQRKGSWVRLFRLERWSISGHMVTAQGIMQVNLVQHTGSVVYPYYSFSINTMSLLFLTHLQCGFTSIQKWPSICPTIWAHWVCNYELTSILIFKMMKLYPYYSFSINKLHFDLGMDDVYHSILKRWSHARGFLLFTKTSGKPNNKITNVYSILLQLYILACFF